MSEEEISVGGQPEQEILEEALPHKEEMLALLRPYGQEHLVAWWDRLGPADQSWLAGQVRSLNLPLVQQLASGSHDGPDWAALARRAEPPLAFRLNQESEYSAKEAGHRGAEMLSQGKVGVLLVAGGQATRLAFDHPKGAYPIGPISQATLFQILFEKLLAVRRIYKASIPLYLMTSPATHEETLEFLHQYDAFGLPAEDLHVFCQGTMPAVDAQTGRILLADKAHIFQSPDGHGGTLEALRNSGNLDNAHQRGVEYMFYCQVDNPLVNLCDESFLGYHLLAGSEISTQAVAKGALLDKVGNIVMLDGKTQIIEYSDLPAEIAEQRDDAGKLRLWAGNTAVHVLSTSFLDRVLTSDYELPFHHASKAVPHLNEQGELVEPQQPNAIKFERFIFDLLPVAQQAIVVEIDEAENFAPLKNANGALRDTPDTVRRQMIEQHRRWLQQAGASVAADIDVEISPLYARNAKELAKKLPPGTSIDQPTYLHE